MAFDQAIADAICEKLIEGASLRQACEGLVAPSSVLFWKSTNPAFAEQYTRARSIGYELLGDDLQEVADDPSIQADQKRIMVDTRKWRLSKMLPKIYGDKLNLEHSGGVKVVSVDPDDRSL